MSMLASFLKDRRGNFAMIAALAAIPLFAGMGMAVDFSRGLKARSLFQDKADSAALTAARQGPTAPDYSMLNYAKTTLPTESDMQDVLVNGRWTAINEYTVTITANLPLTLTQLLPGAPKVMPISAESIVRYKDAIRQYKPPAFTLLDPEAADYNRIYAYCFNPDKKQNVTTKGRSGEVAIADNAGTKYSSPMPSCGLGETMSFRLYNVRGARTTKSKWDDGKTERYDYFTDTELKPQETYDLGGWSILETVLCNSLAECKTKAEGGILPSGKNRTPQRATGTCAPGKFMYYGWEDRPPGRGSSDQDYDDIRVIIECATEEIIGNQSVRLIK